MTMLLTSYICHDRDVAEKKGRVANGKPPVADTNNRVDTKNKKLIEVQPSPSPEN